MRKLVWAIVFLISLMIGDSVAQISLLPELKEEKITLPYILKQEKPTKEEIKAWVILHRQKPWEVRTDTDLAQLAENDTAIKEIKEIEIEGWADTQSYLTFEPYYQFRRELERYWLHIDALLIVALRPELVDFVTLDLALTEILKVEPRVLRTILVQASPLFLQFLEVKLCDLPTQEIIALSPQTIQALCEAGYIPILRAKITKLIYTDIPTTELLSIQPDILKLLVMDIAPAQYEALKFRITEMPSTEFLYISPAVVSILSQTQLWPVLRSKVLQVVTTDLTPLQLEKLLRVVAIQPALVQAEPLKIMTQKVLVLEPDVLKEIITRMPIAAAQLLRMEIMKTPSIELAVLSPKAIDILLGAGFIPVLKFLELPLKTLQPAIIAMKPGTIERVSLEVTQVPAVELASLPIQKLEYILSIVEPLKVQAIISKLLEIPALKTVSISPERLELLVSFIEKLIIEKIGIVAPRITSLRISTLDIEMLQYIPFLYSVTELSELSVPELEILVSRLKLLSKRKLVIELTQIPVMELVKLPEKKIELLLTQLSPVEIKQVAMEIFRIVGQERFSELMGWYYEQFRFARLLGEQDFPEIPPLKLQGFLQAEGLWDIRSQKSEVRNQRTDNRTPITEILPAYRVTELEPGWEKALTITEDCILVVDYGISDYTLLALEQFIKKYQKHIVVGIPNWDQNNNIDHKTDYPERGAQIKRISAIFRKYGIPDFPCICYTADNSDIRWLDSLGFQPSGLWIWNLAYFNANIEKGLEKYAEYSDQFVLGGFFGYYPYEGREEEIESKLPEFIERVKKAGYVGFMRIAN